MKKSEMRVAIAKDVIKQLNAEAYEAKCGGYVEFDESMPVVGSVQKFVKKKTCTVCALGACFVSAVRKYNELNFEDLTDSYLEGGELGGEIKGHLARYFSDKQMALIETAFETSAYFAERGGKYLISEKETAKAVEFGASYTSDNRLKAIMNDNRLKAIMKNVIKNDGTFKP